MTPNSSPKLVRCPSATWLLRLFLVTVVCFAPGGTWKLSETRASNEGPVEFKAGASIVRELGGGGAQLFEISLRTGQILQLSINKGDLGLSLVLYGPGGQKLVEQISRRYEAMELFIAADSAGKYSVEVRSLEVADVRRRYEAKVEIRNANGAPDRKHTAARQAIAEADLLRAEWAENSLRKAIEKYGDATRIWLSARDLQGAAIASMGSAETCFLLGEYRDALQRYKKAAAEAGLAGARLEESRALSKIGRLYSYLGNNDAAQAYVARALDYHHAAPKGTDQALPVKHAYAEALTDAGEIDYSKGDLVKSLQRFEHSLKLFVEIGDRRGEARAHLFLGYLAGGLGEPEKAVAEISRALALYQAVGDKTGEGLSLTALGLSRSVKREKESAIGMHLDAIAIFRLIGDRQSEGIALNAIGQAYEYVSEFQLALDNYQQALRLFQANGSLDFASVSMFKVARTHRLMGNLAAAMKSYEQCLKLSRTGKKTLTEANALNDVAAIYVTQGSREQALGQLRKILNFYRSIGDRRGQAIALNNLGDFFLRAGEKKTALSLYKEALPVSEHSGYKDTVVTTLGNIARTNRDSGALDAALFHITQSIKIIEDLRANVASPDFRSSYFAGVRKHYDLYIDILMKLERLRPGQGFAAAALLASESARARTLREILKEARADIRQGVDAEILKRERELEGLLRSQAQYQVEISNSGKNQTEVAEVARQIDLLRAEYQEIQAKLRDHNPRLLNLTQPSPLSLGEIQGQLGGDGNTLLLEYALGDERSYLWVVTADSVHSYELPSRATLEDAGREVYRLITARQSVSDQIDSRYQANVEASDRLYSEKALSLSRMLLGPVAGQLGNKRLLVVTEGVLQYIPLDALPILARTEDGQNADAAIAQGDFQNLSPMIAAHEVISLPSISTLAAIRLEQRQTSLRNKVVAVLADPVLNADDDRVQVTMGRRAAIISNSGQRSNQPVFQDLEGLKLSNVRMRLAYASEEADAILAAAPRGTSMAAKGFDASRETAMSPQVGQYQILHLATHGLINSEHPELSGIVLTMVNRDGTEAQGFLQLHDIYNLKLSADLTVLSACDTALGKDVKGEGLIGLTRGFMHAGSRTVVASLWKVDDRATAKLMKHFYEAMLQDGMTPAAALRSAKQKIRREKAWSEPFFWAGFVLQGEYNERIVVGSDPLPRPGLVLAVALVVISVGWIFVQSRRRARVLNRWGA